MKNDNQMIMIRLSAIIILLLPLVSGCTFFTGEEDNQEIEKNVQTNINFYPIGSDILLDGETIGQTPLYTNLELETPQEFHTLEIQTENYISYIQRFSVPPTNEISFRGTLTRMVSSESIEDTGSYLGWAGDNFCYYSSEVSQILCQDNDSYIGIHSFALPPDWIIYTQDGIYWQEKNGTTLSVIYYDNERKDSTEITHGWFAADWNAQNQALYLFGYTQNEDQSLSDQLQIQMINPDGNIQSFAFSQIPQGMLPDDCSISSDGQLFLTISSGVFELWQKDASTFIWDSSMEAWQQAYFAPQSGSMIAFINSENDLNILDMTDNQTISIDQSVLSFTWSTEEENLIYAKKTLENSNSLWEYDLTSGQKRMLADPTIINGSVFELAISPHDKMLTYTNRYQRISKLILSE